MQKRVLLCVLIANFTFISQCIGQYNAFKVDLIGSLGTKINLFYERSLNRHFSAGLGVEVIPRKSFYLAEPIGPNTNTIYRMYGYGIIPELRYYPFSKNRPAPLGIFLGSAFRFAAMREEHIRTNVYSTGNIYSFGLNTGYKLRYKQVLFEALIGYGIGMASGFDEEERKNIDSRDLDLSPFFLRFMKDFPRLELSIGLVFPKVKVEKKNNG